VNKDKTAFAAFKSGFIDGSAENRTEAKTYSDARSGLF